MDANVILSIRKEMIKKGIINPNDVSIITQRERGRKFSFEDHLRALIYSLLSIRGNGQMLNQSYLK
jgi:hypothetical protein